MLWNEPVEVKLERLGIAFTCRLPGLDEKVAASLLQSEVRKLDSVSVAALPLKTVMDGSDERDKTSALLAYASAKDARDAVVLPKMLAQVRMLTDHPSADEWFASSALWDDIEEIWNRCYFRLNTVDSAVPQGSGGSSSGSEGRSEGGQEVQGLPDYMPG